MDFFKTIRVYSSFAKGTFKALSSYKANLIMGLIGQLIVVGVTYFLWIAIYSSSQEGIMNGFTLKEMLTYVMITLLIGIVTSNDISQGISFEVRDGSISTNLIKPINYRLRIIFIGIGNFIFFFLTLFLPGAILISTYAILNGININLASILIFLISIILGCLINIYYSYIFGLLSFKFYNIWGISQIARAIIMLVSGAMIPLTFFPEIVQKLFNFLPFSSIIYTPAMIYLNKLSYAEIAKSLGLQLIWVVILMILSKVMWNKVIDKLTIQGG